MDLGNVFEPAITGLFLLAGIWLKDIYAKRVNRVSLVTQDAGLCLTPIMEEIQFSLRAARVVYWEGSNGRKTLSGSHQMHLNALAEATNGKVEKIKGIMQMVPFSFCPRALSYLQPLRNDDVTVSFESQVIDLSLS